MTITKEAKARIEKLTAGHLGMRISVKGGGCSGFQYAFEIAKVSDAHDIVIEECLFIDNISLLYLNDSILDYEKSISGEIFTINNPAVKTTCGCGSSFSV